MDKYRISLAERARFSTVAKEAVDGLWITFDRYAYQVLQIPLPTGEGQKILARRFVGAEAGCW